MKLGAFFHPTGNHIAAWLSPDAQIDAGTNFRHYVDLAQTAERGKFDLMFLADAVATRDGNLEALSRWPQYMAFFDPVTLLSGIAAMTSRIGLVATATTSYNEPYDIARRYASLDHISNGRAGWNIVTSANLTEAYNFGREAHYEHGERYDRAQEFTEVVRGLWDSWEDDAFLRDRSTQRYFDPAKLHYLRHKGEHFSVRGPLNVARPPQGHPVLFQAGSSEVGRDFAARYAEAVFNTLLTIDLARAFSQDVKARMAKYGRAPEHLHIMPGLNVIVGRTVKEAEEKHRFLTESIHPDVGLEMISNTLGGFDLRPYPLDGPLPAALDSFETRGSKGSFQTLLGMARRENLTIRETYQRFAGARGNRTIIGTPQIIADDMQLWFDQGVVDGFLIQPATLPGGLNDFVDLVIPVLQDRGLFRTEYEGTTLRESLHLPRPASRYA
jgi:alkanesulfonate monooxygenase